MRWRLWGRRRGGLRGGEGVVVVALEEEEGGSSRLVYGDGVEVEVEVEVEIEIEIETEIVRGVPVRVAGLGSAAPGLFGVFREKTRVRVRIVVWIAMLFWTGRSIGKSVVQFRPFLRQEECGWAWCAERGFQLVFQKRGLGICADGQGVRLGARLVLCVPEMGLVSSGCGEDQA